MKQLVLYISLLCSWAMVAQEQKYILLDSLMAKYTVKQYTLDTSPYGPKRTIEMYNVLSEAFGLGKKSDFIVLFSVMPDLSSKTDWEEIDFDKIKDNLFPLKGIFKRIEHKVFDVSIENDDDISGVKLIKKIKDKYYVSKICHIEDFYRIESPREVQIATRSFILNTNQAIIPISVLRKEYEKLMPFIPFQLDNILFHIPEVLENTYLSNIEEKGGDTIYYFYQYCNYHNRYICELAYIKDKGIVAGTYGDYFYPIGKIDRAGTKRSDWNKVINNAENSLLWAEELKKEWSVSQTGKEKYKR